MPVKYIKKNKKNYKKKMVKKQAPPSTLSKVSSIAQNALKIASFVKSIVNVEFKFWDNAASLAAQDWNGGLSDLILPAQGTNVNQRTGDSIKLKTLTLRYSWERNPLTSLNQDICRIVIFLDKQNSITTGAQFFTAVGTLNAPFQSKNPDTKFETKTLYDQICSVDQYHPITTKQIVIDLEDHVHFNTGTTNIDHNAIKMLLICQSPTNGSQFSYNSRVTYIDN